MTEDIKPKTNKPHLFQPGQSGNKNGRPKKKKDVEVNKKALKEIFDAAGGNSWAWQKLALQKGSELDLDFNTGFKVSQALLGYEAAKLSTKDSEEHSFTKVEVKCMLPDTYNRLKELVTQRNVKHIPVSVIESFVEQTDELTDENVAAFLEANKSKDV